MKTVHVTDKAKETPIDTGLESVELSIDSSGLVHLMNVLTNLYSNPSEAVLREYTSNAVDSQVRAGNFGKTPIVISIPMSHADAKVFVVRDYGLGMSKQEIINVYSRYGNSTKRDSNEQIGAFGLGAKSALALTDRFDVVSIKDGQKITFYIEKNVNGSASIRFVSEEETTEPSGVEITIPFKDVYSRNWIDNFFVGMPKESLEINGYLNTYSLDNPEEFDIINGVFDAHASGWVATRNVKHVSSVVRGIIGGVVYDISEYELSDIEVMKRLRSLRQDVYINLPIGSVDLTPAREELIYSEKTKDALNVYIQTIYDSLFVLLQSKLNDKATAQEAYDFVSSEYASFWEVDKLKWRGSKVDRSYQLTGPASQVYAPTYNKTSQVEPVAVTYAQNMGTFHDENTLLVVSSEKEFHDDVAMLRRNSRSIQALTGKPQFLVFSAKKDWDNQWIALGRTKGISGAKELIEKAKLHAKKAKAATREANKSIARPPKVMAQVVSFVTKKENGVKNTFNYLERVYADDSRLDRADGKYLYVKKNIDYSVYPNTYFQSEFDEISDAFTDPKGFWKIIREEFSDYTVFALSSQRSIDKFLEEYPTAQRAVDVVKKFATENYKPVLNINHQDVMNNMSWADKQLYNAIAKYHMKLSKDNILDKVTNEDFFDLVSLSKELPVLPSEKEVILARWAEKNLSFESEKTAEIARRGMALSSRMKNYGLLGRVPAETLDTVFLNQMVMIINSIA